MRAEVESRSFFPRAFAANLTVARFSQRGRDNLHRQPTSEMLSPFVMTYDAVVRKGRHEKNEGSKSNMAVTT